MTGRSGRIRTCGPLVPSQVLYQTEPRPDMNMKMMERKTRFELATLALARRCSTTELLPQLATLNGFEPSISAVTGRHVRPLHHRAALLEKMVGDDGIEPPTSCL